MRYISSQFDSRSIDDTLKDMLGATTPNKSSGQTTAGNQQRCAYCQIEINGQAVMALHKYWHPEHFKCADCQQPIGIGAFQERDGKAYCGRHAEGGPVCHKCQQDLRGSFLKACGNTFHKECFICVDCNKSLGSEPFVNKGGSPQCKPCSMKGWK
jgi:paxillin